MAGIIKRTVKGTGKTLADWMDLSVTAGVFLLIKDIFITVFMPWKKGEPGAPETFQEAVKRLKLTEEDIVERQRNFVYQCLIYFGVGLGIIAYGIILAFEGSVMGVIMSILVSFVAFANAFRAHFWYFQTKHRKLGCTLQEWLNSSVKG
jgi:intracellular multiplication protein IcmV